MYDAGANVGYGASVANNNYKWVKETIDATYFWIRNLGTGEYMHIQDQTGSVQCTAIDKNFWSSQWSQDAADAGYVRLRNRWQTGSIIHVENQTGSAQYSGGQDGWHSAHWLLTVVAAREGDAGAEESSASVDIYPNPNAGGKLNVALAGIEDVATITISDVNGKVVSVTKASSSVKINHNLSAGLYFVNVSANSLNVTKKLIVD